MNKKKKHVDVAEEADADIDELLWKLSKDEGVDSDIDSMCSSDDSHVDDASETTDHGEALVQEHTHGDTAGRENRDYDCGSAEEGALNV